METRPPQVKKELVALALSSVMLGLIVAGSSLANDIVSSIPQLHLLAQVDTSGSTTTTTTTTTVYPPTTLNATPNTCGSGTIYLSWPSASGATGYRLSRDGSVIYDGTALSYPDSGLTAASSHSYNVVAYNSSGVSSPVMASAAAPVACTSTTIPAAPSNLMLDGTPAPGNVKIKWTVNSTTQDKFNVERKITTTTGYSYTVWQISGGLSSYTDTTAAVNTTYDYRVQACLSGTGCSDYTYLSGVIVPASGGGSGTTATTYPASPTGLTAMSGGCGINSISLSWIAANGADSYKIYRNGTLVYTTTNLAYMDTGLAFATGYVYTVFGSNSYGMSTTPASVTGMTSAPCTTSTTTSSTIPAAPTSLFVYSYPTTTSVNLHWTDNATNEDKFNIERKLSTATTYSFLYQIMAPNATSYTDSSLATGVSYDYRIQACLSGTGCSAYTYLSGVSIGATANTSTSGGGGGGGTAAYQTSMPTAVPTPPSGLVATAGACGTNYVNLSWIAGNWATTYKIYRSGRYINSVTGLSYVDTGTTPTTNYVYTVYSNNTYGTSTGVSIGVSTAPPCSTTASTTTYTTTSGIPAAPSNLSLYGRAANTIVLKWIDNATNEDKFNIERKLSTAAAYSFVYQIMAPNATSYIDSTVVSGVPYDYRVQACLSGTGCSAYAYLFGVSTLSAVSTTTYPTTTTYSSTTQTTTTFTYATTTTTNTNTNTNSTTASTTTRTATTTTTNTNNRTASTTNILSASSSPYMASTSASTTVMAAYVAPTPEVVKMQDIQTVIDATKTAVNDAKASLVAIINSSIDNAIKNSDPEQLASTTARLESIRTTLLGKIDARLAGLTTITPEQIDTLKKEILAGLAEIRSVAPPTTASSTGAITPSATSTASIAQNSDVAKNLNQLTTALADQSKALKAQGGDLLFKDTNKDGISDYDSKNVYNIDPVKPSPVSTIEGRTVTAGEKVLLGYDPKQTTLVKVVPEEPVVAAVPIATVYKVDDVNLTPEKKVEIKGQALPNSYVTLYVYSTPVIVTVKTDSNGEWHYTMDKELDSGQHTIYTATVNNSGKIIAKSPAFLFTKTAEAATLETVPPVPVSVAVKPTLFSNVGIYALITGLAMIMVIVLLLIGRGIKEKPVAAVPPKDPPALP